ncbi:MAG: PD-(D/E)XK nuclease family protein [Peptostreptococcaceae bacterium]
MNKNLKCFRYSQNSINTYKSCPFKFKYKYIDNINWKYDDVASEEYYQSLKLGREFHLLCERYFSKIPIGIIENVKFEKWIKKIKTILPMEDERVYLPEYEIRYNLDGDVVQAKFELIIIGSDNIEIWDWKTESKKMNHKNVESRMQTMVYLALVQEVVPNIFNLNIKIEDIKMKYYQPEFDEEPIVITYDDDRHKNYINKIKNYIKSIKNTNYVGEGGEIPLEKNEEHCSYCEFNKLCNN